MYWLNLAQNRGKWPRNRKDPSNCVKIEHRDNIGTISFSLATIFSGGTRDSAVDCGQTDSLSNLSRSKDFSLLRNVQNGSRAHPTSSSTGTGVPAHSVSGQGTFTNQLQLAPRLWMIGAIRIDTLYGFLACTRNNFAVLLCSLLLTQLDNINQRNAHFLH